MDRKSNDAAFELLGQRFTKRKRNMSKKKDGVHLQVKENVDVLLAPVFKSHFYLPDTTAAAQSGSTELCAALQRSFNNS